MYLCTYLPTYIVASCLFTLSPASSFNPFSYPDGFQFQVFFLLKHNFMIESPAVRVGMNDSDIVVNVVLIHELLVVVE
jgi:hypothetical protein